MDVVPRGRRLGPRYVVELPLLSRNLLDGENKTVTIKWVYLFTGNKQMAPKPQRDVGYEDLTDPWNIWLWHSKHACLKLHRGGIEMIDKQERLDSNWCREDVKRGWEGIAGHFVGDATKGGQNVLFTSGQRGAGIGRLVSLNKGRRRFKISLGLRALRRTDGGQTGRFLPGGALSQSWLAFTFTPPEKVSNPRVLRRTRVYLKVVVSATHTEWTMEEKQTEWLKTQISAAYIHRY